MDWFKLLIGIAFTLLGIILLIIEIRDGGYKKLKNWGDIMLLFGGVFSLIAGILYIIESLLVFSGFLSHFFHSTDSSDR